MTHDRLKKQRSPGEIINAITRTNEFLKEVSTLDRRKAGRVALAGAALSAAPKIVDKVKEQKGARYEATKSDGMRQLELMAILPDWLKAQQKLDEHRDKMTRRERIKTLKPVVAFNKTVREMIDTEQYTTMSQIKRFVSGTLLYAGYSEEEIAYAENTAGIAINGIRHEIAAESVLSSLPEVYGIDGASAEEEFDGKDIIVTYRGVTLGIDIKSSQQNAEEANRRARWYSDRGDYVAIWSGFKNSDFGDGLIPSREQIKSRQKYFRAVMDRAIEDVSADNNVIKFYR
jgi:hypothetical protein